MKLSYSALTAWFPALDLSPEDVAECLTLSGLEVDGLQPFAPPFTGVVVGQVLSTEEHPNADKLSLCRVLIADDTERSIICGARNVRPGLKVAVATVGATLTSGMTIKRAKLRGIVSEGMLCSREELGLAKLEDGIFELAQQAPVGEDLRAYLSLDEMIFDIDMTPNRGDCLSVRGIARELAAITGIAWQDQLSPVSVKQQPLQAHSLSPMIEAKEACPIYLTQAFDIPAEDLSAVPAWLVSWLTRHGMRSINVVVDLINYVMLMMGQPMHAFDADTIDGPLVVRYANDGESLTLLDGKTVSLTTNTLVITDQSSVQAIAGVMGGDASAVKSHSQRIVVESALFERNTIAGIARQYGLHTESAYRFERGVAPDLAQRALAYLSELLVRHVQAQPTAMTLHCDSEALSRAKTMQLMPNKVNQRLGTALSESVMADYLRRVGCQVSESDGFLAVHAPVHRYDLEINDDLCEEIARIYGYNQIPSTPMQLTMTSAPASRTSAQLDLQRGLSHLGYREAINYSFIAPARQQAFYQPDAAYSLINPIAAHQSQMRQGLLPGLIGNVADNLDRGYLRGRLFECGQGFVFQAPNLQQKPLVAGIAYGDYQAKRWYQAKRVVDFYDVKGDLEALFDDLTIDVAFHSSQVMGFHPGKCAAIAIDGETVGVVGEIHPQVLNDMQIDTVVIAFEILRESLLNLRDQRRYQRLSKYPAIARDLALLVDLTMDYQQLRNLIDKELDKIWLEDIQIFDLYRSESLPIGKKSIGLSFLFRAQDRTLTDQDVNPVMDAIIQKLTSYQISLRE